MEIKLLILTLIIISGYDMIIINQFSFLLIVFFCPRIRPSEIVASHSTSFANDRLNIFSETNYKRRPCPTNTSKKQTCDTWRNKKSCPNKSPKESTLQPMHTGFRLPVALYISVQMFALRFLGLFMWISF